MFAAVAAMPALGEWRVTLRARVGQPARTALLEVRALAAVALRAPQVLHLAEAREVGAPAGVKPIAWTLLTSLPVDTVAAACRVVAIYSRRWLIEEYHKALKSGVGVEQSQLESRARLEPLVGVLSVVALRLLDLKLLARTAPDAPAQTQGLAPEAVLVLRARGLLPKEGAFTHGQLWVAVARLGGFLARKRDGLPGWQTLWRGWQHLRDLTEGVCLARTFLQP